jgi:uncharacterized protein YebE (UPF0316 family)
VVRFEQETWIYRVRSSREFVIDREEIMDALLWTFIIFFARLFDVGLGTIRVQFIVRRQKLPAALTGFVEILIYILIVSRVIQDIDYWPYVLAYAFGFSAGTLLGMNLSERLARRAVQATVICDGSQDAVESALRSAGFAMTRYDGIGRDGPVEVLDIICASGQLGRLIKTVTHTDARAFVYTHDLNNLRGGYVYGLKSKV